MAVSLAVHNLPEGVAVLVSSMKSLRVSIPVAIAIGIHNVPEGLCVALPIYFATGDKRRAILAATLSGLCEPLGVLLFGVFLPDVVSEWFVGICLAFVAGVMTLISVRELLPVAISHAGSASATRWFLGAMVFMAATIAAMDLAMGGNGDTIEAQQ